MDYENEFNLTHPHIEYSVTPFRPVSIISVYSSSDVRESIGVPPTTSWVLISVSCGISAAGAWLTLYLLK